MTRVMNPGPPQSGDGEAQGTTLPAGSKTSVSDKGYLTVLSPRETFTLVVTRQDLRALKNADKMIQDLIQTADAEVTLTFLENSRGDVMKLVGDHLKDVEVVTDNQGHLRLQHGS
jgi:hypothetical protein